MSEPPEHRSPSPMKMPAVLPAISSAIGVVTLLLLLPNVSLAHPPVSVVMDSRGWFYFSDLSHVWVLRGDGVKEIAVPNVHTHELWMSPEDVLYGEDVTNVGERYRHRVWKRYPDGRIVDELGWRDGHPGEVNEYGFVRDTHGHSYVLNRREAIIDIRKDGRRIRSVGYDTSLGHAHWLTVDETGRGYLGLGANVLTFESESPTLETIAESLVTRTEAFSFVHDRHALMGMWPGRERGVFVAVYSGQRVLYADNDGTRRTVYTSSGRWSPVGGMVAEDGSLWLQEWSSGNETRIVHAARDGTIRYF